jgi:hypothetical protein
MYYNEKTGNFAITQPNLTNRVFDEVTHEMIETITGLDPDYVLIADKPSEDYIYDGSQWVAKVPVEPTSSELKAIGMPYTINEISYQVPLTKDAQDTVVALSVAFQMSAITSTNIEFDNGTILPITAADFMNFAIWFTTERNKFFQ